RRLLQIVHQQCLRTNTIVESVLGLARRERAQPEHVDLVGAVRSFIDDYRQTCPEDNASLRQAGQRPEVTAMVDPRHLQQALTSLTNNAVRHGHQPGEAARITLNVDVLDGNPVIEISDRGPGIPDAVTPQLFRPFFTTSEHGTGLGLYIAHELCRANDARLAYVSLPGGGACFRISLRSGNTMLGRFRDPHLYDLYARARGTQATRASRSAASISLGPTPRRRSASARRCAGQNKYSAS